MSNTQSSDTESDPRDGGSAQDHTARDASHGSRWIKYGEPGATRQKVGMSAEEIEDLEQAKFKPPRRAERWHEETDPFRARVLYQMAAVGYEARTGQAATPALLNREYPASKLKPRSHGSWNLTRLGKHLPRASSMKEGHAMRALAEQDPAAAAVFDWALWPLASYQEMAMPEVHAAMLRLDDSVRHWLVGIFWNGRFQRWPNERLLEVEWMRRVHTISSLVALLALLREAELEQDAVVYDRAYVVLCEHLPLLDAHKGLSVVSTEFGEYLVKRFKRMSYLMPGAYDQEPGTGKLRPVLIKLSDKCMFNIAAAEFLWRGEDSRIWPPVLAAGRIAADASFGVVTSSSPGASK